MMLKRWSRNLLVAVLCAAGTACAQDGGKPLRIVIGFGAGGAHDIVARVLAPGVGAALKVQAVVDSRPGANGMIAGEIVARAPADGNTVILTGVSTFVLNQLVYAKAPYDTPKDFAAVTTVAATPQVFVAHPGLPVKTLADIAALAPAVDLIHLKDRDLAARRTVPLGDGGVPWAQELKRLLSHARAERVLASMETHCPHDGRNATAKSVATLRRIAAEIGADLV